MKKKILLLYIMIIILNMTACKKDELYVVKTYEQTPIEKIEETFDKEETVIETTHYEMSDGTWKTDDCTYKYRLELTGRLNNAEKESTYIVLSNIEDITFEQAWKASGLSSNSSDYFDEKDAVIVGVKLTELEK